MKIHITNLYNFNPNDELVQKQHRFANAGRELGFYEMGIFSYPVETDTPGELSKRLDGIIAALESEDVVFMQLPTRNGYAYENLLLKKLKTYKAKVVFLLHNLSMIDDSNKALQEKYISLFKQADAISVPSITLLEQLKNYSIANLIFLDRNFSLCDRNFYPKKLLLDVVTAILSENISITPSNIPVSEAEIQIGFGLHDKTGNYSMWVGTAMQSIIENTTSKISFHIIHDKTLSDANKEKLSYVAISKGHQINFYLLDDTIFDNLVEQVSYFTIGALFRIMLPELLPQLNKILYLDADILVNRDIKELWNIDIQPYALAAVPDFGSLHGFAHPLPVKKHEVDAKRYFNTGVLSINLSYFHEKRNMKMDVLHYLKNNKDAAFPDQDALNSLYNKDTLLLDSSWNYFVRHIHETKDHQFDKKIYHYAATRLKLYTLTEVDNQYYETLCRTPWGKEEGQKILYQALKNTTNRIMRLERIISLLSSSSKKRIFYGHEDHVMKNIYSLLSVRENDYRILKVPDTNTNCILPCKIFSTLETETPGSYVVFVLPVADNFTALTNLNNLGLKQDTDYFIINQLLPPELGGYV